MLSMQSFSTANPVPTPDTDAHALTPPQPCRGSSQQHLLSQRLRDALWRAWGWGTEALARAERRITEGFRVPPHGG
ncbi:hypothetical protein [Acidovorax sp.]|uniref:hypothetical protein n=1 Tax=Acidovorax sp. TaxID=1872122 RepID=UPI00391D403B